MIPPYRGVRLVEYHDRIALKPIAWSREFLGLCKIDAGDKEFRPWEGMNSKFVDLLRKGDIWLIIRWKRYEDDSEEVITVEYIAEATEAEVRERYDQSLHFLMMSKEELLRLESCFEVPKEDRDYIPDRFPMMPPDPKSIEEHDLYQARLKVLAGMQPKTVRLIYEAEATNDPVQRAKFEAEAVSAYYAEMAHYWNPETVTEWQRTNPIATEWICEFANVFKNFKKELNPIDHAIVLNWLRRGYSLITAEELANDIFKITGERLSPEAIKKRRERLGLVSKRKPGPPTKA